MADFGLGQLTEQDLEGLSDEDLMHLKNALNEGAPAIEATLPKTKTEAALQMAEPVFTALDYLGPAEFRAGVGKIQETGSPIEGVKAGVTQFAKSPSEAPSSEQLAEGFGIQNPTAKRMAALGIDVLSPGVGQLIGPSALLSKGYRGAKAFGRGAQAVLTGVPYEEIGQIYKGVGGLRPGKGAIQDLVKATGGEDVLMADKVRNSIDDAAQNFRKKTNASITSSLSKNKDKLVDVSGIADQTFDRLREINRDASPELHDALYKEFSRLLNLTKDGKAPARDLFQFQQRLEDISASGVRQSGQMFASGSQVEKNLSNLSSSIKQAIYDSVPEVRKDMGSLAELHDIEGLLRGNILKEGAPTGQIAAASKKGTSTNKALERLQDLTGKKVLPEVETYSAARRYENAPALPVDTTGKAGVRMGLAALAGGAAGYGTGDPYLGAIVAGSTSPWLQLRAGKLASKAVDPLISAGIKGLENPAVRAGMSGAKAASNDKKRARMKALEK